jgi:hypothetical protein
MIFIQKKQFVTRTFELTEDGILINYKRFQKYEEFIRYEDIPDNRFNFTIFPKVSFFGALICLFLFVTLFISSLFVEVKTDEIESSLFYLAIAIAFGIYYWLNKGSYVSLNDGNKNIPFFKNSPSVEKVDDFLHKIIEEKNKFIDTKYKDNFYFQPVDDSSVSNEIFKLSRLKERDIISEEEFHKMKKDLIDGNDKKRRTVGFNLSEME